MSYRNDFERRCGAMLGQDYQYEAVKLTYTTTHTYTPDFVDAENKVIVESKGFLHASDRAKMIAVKAAHPGWTIRICFQNPNRTISKASKTTYRAWAERHGFEVVVPPPTK